MLQLPLESTDITMLTKLLALFVLVLCSGCSKAEMSDARMNHLMAGDHGWIDLTMKVPAPSKEQPVTHDCAVTFSVNGETLLRESANFIAAHSKGSPIGYRFPAPSGQLDVELIYSLCSKEPLVIRQPLTLMKDHLAKVTFDDASLAIDGAGEYKPASLEWVGSQLEGMRNAAADTDHRLSNTNVLVLVCLVLNLLALVVLIWRRPRAL